MWLSPFGIFEKPTRKLLHLGRLYFFLYKVYLKRASASIILPVAHQKGKFVLVVVQVDNAAVWQRGKFFCGLPVYSALHLYCTNHVEFYAAFKPGLYPLQKTLGVADYVA